MVNFYSIIVSNMAEATNTNPYDLVGAVQVPVPEAQVVPPVIPVTPVPVAPIPQTPIPVKKPGESFFDKLIRTIARLMGNPDPFTGLMPPMPQWGQVAQIPGEKVAVPKVEEKNDWLVGTMVSWLEWLVKTAGDLAGQVVKEVKQANTPQKPADPVPPVVK